MESIKEPIYPRRQEEFSCILTRHQPAVFPPISADVELRDLMQYIDLMQDAEVIIRSISEDRMELEFDVLRVEPCIANSLRRCLLSDVCTLLH